MAQRISDVIREVLDEGDIPPKAVNRGECDPFAVEVVQRLDTEDVWTMYTRELPEEDLHSHKPDVSPEPIHTWVTDGTKHYDAECPDGVERWQELPIFQRWGYY